MDAVDSKAVPLILTFFAVTVACHLCSPGLRPKWRELLQDSRSLLLGGIGKESDAESEESLESEVRTWMDERRVSNMLKINNIIVVMLPASAFLLHLSSPQVQSSRSYNFFLLSQLIIYMISLAVKSEAIKLTPKYCKAICVLIYAILLLRILNADSVWISETNVGRVHNRILVGLLMLDRRCNFRCNLCLLSVAICQRTMALQEDVVLAFFKEILDSFACYFIPLVVETLMIETASASIRRQASDFERSGVQRLLSVFSEAQLQLTTELSIQKAAHFSQLLLFGQSYDVRGRKFSDFLVEDDQPRFLDFIQQALETSRQAGSQPASTLHVSLRGASGCEVRVELFHAAIPGGNSITGHLLGVCEKDSREPESQDALPGLPRIRSRAPSSSSSLSSRRDVPQLEEVQVKVEPFGGSAGFTMQTYELHFNNSAQPSFRNAVCSCTEELMDSLQSAVEQALADEKAHAEFPLPCPIQTMIPGGAKFCLEAAEAMLVAELQRSDADATGSEPSEDCLDGCFTIRLSKLSASPLKTNRTRLRSTSSGWHGR